MRVVAIIQARMMSTRLPGKVLADLCGRPLLGRVIDRTRRAKQVHDVVVATSTASADDILAEYASAEGVGVFRGSEQDVLDRYYRASRQAEADVVVRITSDDPFKEPAVID